MFDKNQIGCRRCDFMQEDEELFEQLYLDLETYYKEEVLEKQEPHLSNILDDINYIKSVDTKIGE